MSNSLRRSVLSVASLPLATKMYAPSLSMRLTAQIPLQAFSLRMTFSAPLTPSVTGGFIPYARKKAMT